MHLRLTLAVLLGLLLATSPAHADWKRCLKWFGIIYTNKPHRPETSGMGELSVTIKGTTIGVRGLQGLYFIAAVTAGVQWLRMPAAALPANDATVSGGPGNPELKREVEKSVIRQAHEFEFFDADGNQGDGVKKLAEQFIHLDSDKWPDTIELSSSVRGKAEGEVYEHSELVGHQREVKGRFYKLSGDPVLEKVQIEVVSDKGVRTARIRLIDDDSRLVLEFEVPPKR